MQEIEGNAERNYCTAWPSKVNSPLCMSQYGDIPTRKLGEDYSRSLEIAVTSTHYEAMSANILVDKIGKLSVNIAK